MSSKEKFNRSFCSTPRAPRKKKEKVLLGGREMLKGGFTVQTGTADIRATYVVLWTPRKPAPVLGGRSHPTQNQPGPVWPVRWKEGEAPLPS